MKITRIYPRVFCLIIRNVCKFLRTNLGEAFTLFTSGTCSDEYLRSTIGRCGLGPNIMGAIRRTLYNTKRKVCMYYMKFESTYLLL